MLEIFANLEEMITDGIIAIIMTLLVQQIYSTIFKNDLSSEPCGSN